MLMQHIEADIPVTPEPEIQENPGALELPASGFLLDVRDSCVRMHFFVVRGRDDTKRRDEVLIVHLSLKAFGKSFARAARKWLVGNPWRMN